MDMSEYTTLNAVTTRYIRGTIMVNCLVYASF